MVNPVIQDLINKTLQELSQQEKPAPRSRMSNTPNGYIHLVAWSNAHLLRIYVVHFTEALSKSHYRLKTQVDDAARSVIANIEKGFSRPTTGEYVTFLGYSQASLIEVKGDIQRCRQDGLLESRSGSSLVGLGINLRDWHEALKRSMISRPSDADRSENAEHVYTAVAEPKQKPKGIYGNIEEFNKSKNLQHPLNSFKFFYLPVDDLKATDLTYEIFIELVNKTDWHLRRLVESLEDKLNQDQKFYQVEKARARSKLTFRR